MRVLIMGGDGMLGHQVFKYLGARHEVKVTLRQDLAAYQAHGLFNYENSYAGIDVRNINSVLEAFADFRPQAVINGVGIVKQRSTAKENIPSLEVNALLPHRLSVLCRTVGSRLIQISTDCVFSGRKGNYTETDQPDAEDLYGRTKLLGEVAESHCLTLRTSIIGTELSRKKSLLEWLLAQRGTVTGYRNAIFSGFTTIEMSRIIEKMPIEHTNAAGIYHVSSASINKFDLLCLLKEKLGLSVKIEPDESVNIDRSLNSERFREEFAYIPPSWETMANELSQDYKKGLK